MYIELAEMLRCPGPHEESFLVVATEAMAGRSVRRGVVGCPICQAEYPVAEGVVRFGTPAAPREPRELPSADTIHALLALGGPGGYVVLVGSPARQATALAAFLPGVHFVGVNAPLGVLEAAHLTLLEADGTVPLRTQIARGVIVGAEFAYEPWLSEAARVVLPGRHVIVAREGVEIPGTQALASGLGLSLAERR